MLKRKHNAECYQIEIKFVKKSDGCSCDWRAGSRFGHMEHRNKEENGDNDIDSRSVERIRQESTESSGGDSDSAELERKVFAAINDGDRKGLQEMFAKEEDSTEILQILLTTSYQNHEEFYSHDPDVLTDAHELLGDSVENLNAVQIACMLGDEEMALDILSFVHKVTDEMVARKVLYEFMGRVWGKGNTVLHLAAFSGMSELVKKLLEDGANPNRKNERGYKPVDCADDDITRKMFTTISEVLPKSSNVSAVSPLHPSRPQYSVENVLAWPARHLVSTSSFRNSTEDNLRNEKKIADRKRGMSVQLQTESLSAPHPTSPPTSIPIPTEQRQGAVSSDNLPYQTGRPGILVKTTKSKVKNLGRVLFDPGTTVLDICMRGDPVDNETLPTLRETLGLGDALEESTDSPVDLTVDINNLCTPHQWLTALHLACTHGNTNIVQLLIGNEVRAMVNVKDKEGWTPFHCAVAEGHIEIIKLLGKCQGRTEDDFSTSAPPGSQVTDVWFYPPDGPIDLTAETDDGETLEDVALEENEKEIKALLKDFAKKFPPKPRSDLHSHPLKSTVEEGSDGDDGSDDEEVENSKQKIVSKVREGTAKKETSPEIFIAPPLDNSTTNPASPIWENEIVSHSLEGSFEELQVLRGERDHPAEMQRRADFQTQSADEQHYDEDERTDDGKQPSSLESKDVIRESVTDAYAESAFDSKSDVQPPDNIESRDAELFEVTIGSIELESCQLATAPESITEKAGVNKMERGTPAETPVQKLTEPQDEQPVSFIPYADNARDSIKPNGDQICDPESKVETSNISAPNESRVSVQSVRPCEDGEKYTEKPNRTAEPEKSPPVVRMQKSQIPVSTSKRSQERSQMESSTSQPREKLTSSLDNAKSLPNARNGAISEKVSFFQSVNSGSYASSKPSTAARTSEVRSFASPTSTNLLEKTPPNKLGYESKDVHREGVSGLDVTASPPPLPTKSSAEINRVQPAVDQPTQSASEQPPFVSQKAQDGYLQKSGSGDFDDGSSNPRRGSKGSPKESHRSKQQGRESVTRSNRPSVTTYQYVTSRKGDSPSKPVTPTRGSMAIAVLQSSSPLPASLSIALAEKPAGGSPLVSPQKLVAPTAAKLRDTEQKGSPKNGRPNSASSTDARRRSAWTKKGMGSRTSSEEQLAITSAHDTTSACSDGVNNLFDRDPSHLNAEPAKPQNVVHLHSHGCDSHPAPSRPQPTGVFLARSASVKERVRRFEQSANSGKGAATRMKTLDEMAADNADKNGAPTAVSNSATQVPSKTKAAASRTGSKGAIMGTPTRGGAATVKKDGIGINRLKRQQAQARVDK
ncbi:hypothetical protein BJ742DRAFT_859107 [Cladochytrium replicatum]|nr:hypothetical protein BJ742DRAFT_859107 [Cladochytrium replicatum]